MCTATQVRSLGPSQLAQGAMPALAAALRVALLGRLALASAVPIGHDGLAAAANLAPQACWSAPSGERVCMQHAGEATCGEDRWCGVVPPEMFGMDKRHSGAHLPHSGAHPVPAGRAILRRHHCGRFPLRAVRRRRGVEPLLSSRSARSARRRWGLCLCRLCEWRAVAVPMLRGLLRPHLPRLWCQSQAEPVPGHSWHDPCCTRCCCYCCYYL